MTVPKYYLLLLHTIVAILGTIIPAFAQSDQLINLNNENGLPSNLVYGMITDRNGYLWISTDKGVVRYNGRECKLFNLSNGLPTEDIWELLEDRKGRIWLGSISDEIGYIYKNKYHRAYVKNLKESLYPKHTRLWGNGIIFVSGNLKNFGIFYEKNDTIYAHYAKDIFFSNGESVSNFINDSAIVLINELGTPIGIFNGAIYAIEENKLTGHLECKALSILDNRHTLNYQDVANTIIGDYIISYHPGHNKKEVFLTNIKTGQVEIDTLPIPDTDFIHYLYPERKPTLHNIFYIITNKNILKCSINQHIQIIDSYSINAHVTNFDNNTSISTVHKSALHGYCIGTTSKGAWLKQTGGFNATKKRNLNIENYKPVGNHKGIVSFWWNKSSKSIAVISDSSIHYYKINNIINVKFVNHFAADTFFVGGETANFFIISTGKFIPISILNYGSGFLSSLVLKDSAFLTTSFGYYSVKTANNKYTRYTYDLERYNDILYDSFKKRILVYNKFKIATFNASMKTLFDKEKLNAIGIKGLEKIHIDHTYNNLFLKGYDNVVMYNSESDTAITLFNNLRFKDEATMLFQGNKLIITWKYGVLFSVVLGKMKVSAPLLYLNSYTNKYKTVYGSSIVGNHLLLNTDNGLFEIDIPHTNKILAQQKSILHNYHFIVNYDDSTRNITNNDTIVVEQVARKLIFDLIYLNRSGPLTYYYSFNNPSKFIELNANEINIPTIFAPDNYCKLYIYVADNSWKSNVIELNLYIKPYWWQTKWAKKSMGFGATILGIAIILIAVWVTKKMVLRAAEKRQLQMEMELKSIYSQINPHFIFNSLNSALLLVTKNRMEEAYNHISKFSHLLRSYLKSSRNKLISVQEEVENLRNYLELQQTRFKDKFLFDIKVDNNIDQSSVQIPSLLLQPFVENAINHGITLKQEKGHIKIEFIQKEKEKKIICTIDDDGIGRKKAKAEQSLDEHKKESYGNLMIKDLISIFRRYEGMFIDIKYTDKQEPLSGTTVTITIQYPDNER